MSDGAWQYNDIIYNVIQYCVKIKLSAQLLSYQFPLLFLSLPHGPSMLHNPDPIVIKQLGMSGLILSSEKINPYTMQFKNLGDKLPSS